MIVISDTTPVISLLKAKQLDILHKMFGVVLIPEAVYKELTSNQKFQSEATLITSCTFIHVVEVQNKESVKIFRKVTGLDAGESEAIVLAEEQKSDLLLMDEHKGRQTAIKLGIRITGTIGILLHAFQDNLLTRSQVEDCLDKMQNSGIRISNSLRESILQKIASE